MGIGWRLLVKKEHNCPVSSDSVWENNFSLSCFSRHYTTVLASKFFKAVEIDLFGKRNGGKQTIAIDIDRYIGIRKGRVLCFKVFF